MKFSADVQEQFRKAGWYPGRNVREVFDAVPGFEKFPLFLKAFLYEYGNLEVPCLDPENVDVSAILDLRAIPAGYVKVQSYLGEPRHFDHQLFTFPVGYYLLDSAVMECDAEGKVYMVGDNAARMAHNFKEGVERVIREDYRLSGLWDDEHQSWTAENYF